MAETKNNTPAGGENPNAGAGENTPNANTGKGDGATTKTAEQKLKERVAELEQQNKELKTENKGFKKDISGLEETLAEAVSENKALAATKGNPNPVVTVDGTSYQVRGGARIKGRGKMTSKEISEDKNLCAQLVASNSELLAKI